MVRQPAHQRIGERIEGPGHCLHERDVTERNQHDVGVDNRQMNDDRNGHSGTGEAGWAEGQLGS